MFLRPILVSKIARMATDHRKQDPIGVLPKSEVLLERWKKSHRVQHSHYGCDLAANSHFTSGAVVLRSFPQESSLGSRCGQHASCAENPIGYNWR